MNKNDPRLELLKEYLKQGFSGDYAAKKAGIGYTEWNLARHDQSIQTIIRNKSIRKHWDWIVDKRITLTDYREQRKKDE